MIDKLIKIQKKLKVPKNQLNKFGNYKYRSCEDILEAVKPICHSFDVAITVSDEIVEIGGRVYVKARALLKDMESDKETWTYGFARESESKKGMDDSQITGSASSYARKYALNGLFCIDDTKDADATNTHGKDDIDQTARPVPFDELLDKFNTAKNEHELKARWTKYSKDMKFCTEDERETLKMAKDERKMQLKGENV